MCIEEVKNVGGRPSGMTKATIERRKYIIDQLKKGKLPKEVIVLTVEKFDVSYSVADKLVYNCNREIKESLQDFYDEAADYIVTNLQDINQEAREKGDRKNALKALEQLAKIVKVGADDGKQDITINFGFDFTDDSKQ